MRNILALLGAALVVVAALGWYLGWYHVQTTSSNISIDVDQKKVATDIKKGVQEGTEKVENFLKKEGATSQPAAQQISPTALPGAQSRFSVDSDGKLQYTGEVSYPQPVTK